MVWIIGRTQTNGPKDYPAVQAIQNQYKLTPLSAFGKPYTSVPGVVDPTVDMKLAPVEAVAKMGTAAFFDRMAAFDEGQPPARGRRAGADEARERSGRDPGLEVRSCQARPGPWQRGWKRRFPVAMEKLTAASKETGAPVNGWRVPSMKLADFGTDYGTRAVVALVGLGANLAADAVYPSAFIDGEAKTLNGANRYVLHFAKGEEPPVRAFWSVTDDRTQILLLRGQPYQPLRREQLDAVQAQRRQLARPLHPERVARQGQGSELAAGAARVNST